MAILRIVTPVRLRLTDNLPKYNNPRKHVGLRIIAPVRLRVGKSEVATTLSGSVKNAEGVGLAGRNVWVFGDQAMLQRLGIATSGADGTWSITVVAGPRTPITCVVQGEPGENTEVFARIGGEA